MSLSQPRFSLELYIATQIRWSSTTFGPGARTDGVIDHITKELKEIKSDPKDLKEWVDVIILALDGAWRAGHLPSQIVEALTAKQIKNMARKWPDWRKMSQDQAIEHIREETV